MSAVLKNVMSEAVNDAGQGNGASTAQPVVNKAAVAAEKPARVPRWTPMEVRAVLSQVLAPVAGLALMVAIWAFIALKVPQIPSPAVTFAEAVKLFSDPFYIKGPNDQGIGWNLLSSLKRVGIGFGLAALVGIPLGFIIGRFGFCRAWLHPSSACSSRFRRWPGCRSVC